MGATVELDAVGEIVGPDVMVAVDGLDVAPPRPAETSRDFGHFLEADFPRKNFLGKV